jgi:hypothetical protein
MKRFSVLLALVGAYDNMQLLDSTLLFAIAKALPHLSSEKMQFKAPLYSIKY